MGAHGYWRSSRASNPLAGSNKVRGEFDPHALPSFSVAQMGDISSSYKPLDFFQRVPDDSMNYVFLLEMLHNILNLITTEGT